MDRRRYTREFKIEAVKLVRGGLPFDQVLGLQAQEPSWPANGFATKLPTPGQHRRHLMYDANMSDDAPTEADCSMCALGSPHYAQPCARTYSRFRSVSQCATDA
jgi:hypothetical protein